MSAARWAALFVRYWGMLAFSLAAGGFGLLVGSFLNVLVLRRATGRSATGVSGEGSACMSCGTHLKWYDLVPVLSWLMLSGRCRHCGSRISVQYPLVEASSGALFFALAYTGMPYVPLVVSFAIASVLITLAAYDIRHTILPDPWVWTFAALSLAYALAGGEFDAYAFVAGPATALPLFALWSVSRGAWMGLGDVKLALGIGWLLGPLYGLTAIFLSFVIGALVSVCVLLPLSHVSRVLRRWGIVRGAAPASYTMKSEVPFGPFLIASGLSVWMALLYGISLPFPWI